MSANNVCSTGSLEADLIQLFDCPVCFENILPPIMQCPAGHTICSVCLGRIQFCPTCRGPVTNPIRNLQMEKIAESLSFPCTHQSRGCTALLRYVDKVIHEAVCDFQPYPCPCPRNTCTWQGSWNEIITHVSEHHKTIPLSQGQETVFVISDYDSPWCHKWVMFLSAFQRDFLLTVEKDVKHNETQYNSLVQLMGPHSEAANFLYRLELNGNFRRLAWEGRTTSTAVDMRITVSREDCLTFSAVTALHFAINSNLAINMSISKLDEP